MCQRGHGDEDMMGLQEDILQKPKCSCTGSSRQIIVDAISRQRHCSNCGRSWGHREEMLSNCSDGDTLQDFFAHNKLDNVRRASLDNIRDGRMQEIAQLQQEQEAEVQEEVKEVQVQEVQVQNIQQAQTQDQGTVQQMEVDAV